jgi:hypothetical protein
LALYYKGGDKVVPEYSSYTNDAISLKLYRKVSQVLTHLTQVFHLNILVLAGLWPFNKKCVFSLVASYLFGLLFRN